MIMQLKNIQHDFDTPAGDVGVTVRLGTKWSHQLPDTVMDLWECPQGHKGDCVEPQCQWRGTARILGSWVGPFDQLPPALLSIEHNNDCRTVDGLAESMLRGYGDKFSAESVVTALIYVRTVRAPE